MLTFPQNSAGTFFQVPRRTDSLKTKTSSNSKSNFSSATSASLEHDKGGAIFTAIEDDLRDAQRVHIHGQEEDLRYALSRMMSRVSELAALLKEAQQRHTDLETSLSLAQSNLKLLMSNNEMLEEALARTPNSAAASSVGWQRRSGRESLDQAQSEDVRPQSVEYHKTKHDLDGSDTASLSSPVRSSPPLQDGKFFRFRFSNNSTASTSNLNSGRTKNAATTRSQSVATSPSPDSPQIHAVQSSHLTSSSMPSLVSMTSVKDREKEVEELNERLDREKAAHKQLASEKAALEAELESLSQALFEEANKMVAEERIHRAEAEEELRELQREKEALRSALRLMAGQNGRLRGLSLEEIIDETEKVQHSLEGHEITEVEDETIAHSRSSSLTGVKSPILALHSPSSSISSDVPSQNTPSSADTSTSKTPMPRSLDLPPLDSPLLATSPSAKSVDDDPATGEHISSLISASMQLPLFSPLYSDSSPWADTS